MSNKDQDCEGDGSSSSSCCSSSDEDELFNELINVEVPFSTPGKNKKGGEVVRKIAEEKGVQGSEAKRKEEGGGVSGSSRSRNVKVEHVDVEAVAKRKADSAPLPFSITSPSQLKWHRHTKRGTVIFSPCRVCDPDEAIGLYLPQTWDENRQTLIQNIEFPSLTHRSIVNRTALLPYYDDDHHLHSKRNNKSAGNTHHAADTNTNQETRNNDNNNDETAWNEHLCQEYAKQLKRKKKDIIACRTEILFLGRILQHARHQERIKQQEQKEQLVLDEDQHDEEQGSIALDEEAVDISTHNHHESNEPTNIASHVQTISDDEHEDSDSDLSSQDDDDTTKKKKKEPIRPGDVITYRSHIFGDRTATVLSVNRKRNPILSLNNGENLPPDTQVRRLQVMYRGHLREYDHGTYRPIERYQLRTLGTAGAAAGILGEADHISNILNTHTAKIRNAAKQDGFAPLDILNKYKGAEKKKHESNVPTLDENATGKENKKKRSKDEMTKPCTHLPHKEMIDLLSSSSSSCSYSTTSTTTTTNTKRRTPPKTEIQSQEKTSNHVAREANTSMSKGARKRARFLTNEKSRSSSLDMAKNGPSHQQHVSTANPVASRQTNVSDGSSSASARPDRSRRRSTLRGVSSPARHMTETQLRLAEDVKAVIGQRWGKKGSTQDGNTSWKDALPQLQEELSTTHKGSSLINPYRLEKFLEGDEQRLVRAKAHEEAEKALRHWLTLVQTKATSLETGDTSDCNVSAGKNGAVSSGQDRNTEQQAEPALLTMSQASSSSLMLDDTCTTPVTANDDDIVKDFRATFENLPADVDTQYHVAESFNENKVRSSRSRRRSRLRGDSPVTHMSKSQLRLAEEVKAVMHERWGDGNKDSCTWKDNLKDLEEELSNSNKESSVTLYRLEKFLEGDKEKIIRRRDHEETEKELRHWLSLVKDTCLDSKRQSDANAFKYAETLTGRGTEAMQTESALLTMSQASASSSGIG